MRLKKIMPDRIDIFIKELNKKMKQSGRIILAIDGECASLKSTLAQALQTKYNAGTIHCDDFFLPLELRTPERFREPGGNIDYVRMKEEVIDRFKESEAIKYRAFDCHSMSFAEMVSVMNAKLMIVEGAYAMHPYFDKYYDISVFLCAKEEERLRRIANRGQDVERFINRWIPLENRYFEACGIRRRADYVIDTTKYTGLTDYINTLKV